MQLTAIKLTLTDTEKQDEARQTAKASNSQEGMQNHFGHSLTVSIRLFAARPAFPFFGSNRAGGRH